MRVLVTGAAGFIGSYVAEGLLREGHTVICVDDLSGGLEENWPKLPQGKVFNYKVDLANYDAVEEIFCSRRPEIVYHCASCAREGASEYQPYKIVHTNVEISSVVIELGVKYGMKKFVFTSSMSVYGEGKVPFSENQKRNPVDPYGVCKAAVERIIEIMSETHRFSYTIIRPHNVFGPRQALFDSYRNVVGIFMNRIMRGDKVLYLYGRDHIRAFSYIEDCLPCLVKAADLGTANGEIINLGGSEPITVKEMALEVIKNFAEYERPDIVELPPRPHEVKEAYCTVEKSVKLLGYEEKIGWREGVRLMANWAKAKGPQEWRVDNLPLLSDGAPKPWLELVRGKST